MPRLNQGAAETSAWLAATGTVAILAVYELVLLVVQRRHPSRLARSAHAALRQDWFAAVSGQRGSEILAVQTLRNSLMSATMTASTAALGLMGAVTLSAPSLHASLGDGFLLSARCTARLALELVLIALLFASLVCSAMAVRYYHHAGFISGMPVESDERRRWSPIGSLYLRRAGLLYSWGLRHLLVVAPILTGIVYPWAGPVAAFIVMVVLAGFDKFSLVEPPREPDKSQRHA